MATQYTTATSVAIVAHTPKNTSRWYHRRCGEQGSGWAPQRRVYTALETHPCLRRQAKFSPWVDVGVVYHCAAGQQQRRRWRRMKREQPRFQAVTRTTRREERCTCARQDGRRHVLDRVVVHSKGVRVVDDVCCEVPARGGNRDESKPRVRQLGATAAVLPVRSAGVSNNIPKHDALTAR